MTREEIIKLAREAGLRSAVLLHMYGKEDALCDSEIEELRQLERFATILAAAEREQCARIAAWILKMPENDVSAAMRAGGN